MITTESDFAGQAMRDFKRPGWKVPAGIAALSAIYFADIMLKASQKCFWFDELFSVYLCRLPTFGATWSAVVRGADFNPPLFYLLTRIAERMFGEGLIATRLPPMIGVWIFCLCLYSFVARRAGLFAGLIAGLFPFFTLAQYYAYEARPHGITVGWCGLALLCWQRNSEGRARYLWLAGFGLSLLGAMLTHAYAVYLLVPFAVVEAYNLLHKPNWGIVFAMAVAFLSVTLTVFLPMSRVYRKTMASSFVAAPHDFFERFLFNVIGPALIIFLLSIVATVTVGTRARRLSATISSIPIQERLLAAGFACLPIVGIAGSKVTHGPLVDRYFLSSVAGFAIFLGFANSREFLEGAAVRGLAGCMVLLMFVDLAATVYLTERHIWVLAEPSSQLRLTTTPQHPMALYGALMEDQSGLDVLVPSPLEYLYFVTYAPPTVVRHLYFIAPADDIFYRAFERLRSEAHVNLQMTPFEPFLATHNQFLIYESGRPNANGVRALAKEGRRLASAASDVSGTLYRFEQ